MAVIELRTSVEDLIKIGVCAVLEPGVDDDAFVLNRHLERYREADFAVVNRGRGQRPVLIKHQYGELAGGRRNVAWRTAELVPSEVARAS